MVWPLFAMGCQGETMFPDDPGETTFLDDPLEPYPETLGEVGIYRDFATGEADPRAFLYAPRYPLYSNGLDKERFIVLPESEPIDVSGEMFAYPVGTLLFKTFWYADGEARAPVETRILRRTETDWDYAVYVYRPDGTEADLAPMDAPVPVEVTIDGESFEHAVPDRFSCRMCHESHTHQVIGFNAVQLGGGPGSELARATEQGLFTAEPHDPGDPIPGDAAEAWVLRYVQGNCIHCHNGLGGSSRAFDMAPEAFTDNTVGVSTTGSGIEPGVRVVAGSPETSVLFRMLDFETFDVEPMPPVGVERADREAVAQFRTWIEALEDE